MELQETCHLSSTINMWSQNSEVHQKYTGHTEDTTDTIAVLIQILHITSQHYCNFSAPSIFIHIITARHHNAAPQCDVRSRAGIPHLKRGMK